jgi:hypothetical protein
MGHLEGHGGAAAPITGTFASPVKAGKRCAEGEPERSGSSGLENSHGGARSRRGRGRRIIADHPRRIPWRKRDDNIVETLRIGRDLMTGDGNWTDFFRADSARED